MKNKKVILIIILVIIIIIVGILLIKKNNKNNTTYVSNVTEMSQIEQEAKKELEQSLNQGEKDYQEGVEKFSNYTRTDFYNEIRLSSNAQNSEISIVTLEDIEIDKLYSTSGEKLESLPEITSGITIQDNVNDIQVGNYYLIKCSEIYNKYTYYYIWNILYSGKSNLQLYCYTEN